MLIYAACRLPPAACRLPPAACLLPPAACRLPPALMSPLCDAWHAVKELFFPKTRFFCSLV
jgi:hypothetical protein